MGSLGKKYTGNYFWLHSFQERFSLGFCVIQKRSASKCVYFVRSNTLLLCISLLCIYLLYLTDAQTPVVRKWALDYDYPSTRWTKDRPTPPFLVYSKRKKVSGLPRAKRSRDQLQRRDYMRQEGTKPWRRRRICRPALDKWEILETVRKKEEEARTRIKEELPEEWETWASAGATEPGEFCQAWWTARTDAERKSERWLMKESRSHQKLRTIPHLLCEYISQICLASNMKDLQHLVLNPLTNRIFLQLDMASSLQGHFMWPFDAGVIVIEEHSGSISVTDGEAGIRDATTQILEIDDLFWCGAHGTNLGFTLS